MDRLERGAPRRGRVGGRGIARRRRRLRRPDRRRSTSFSCPLLNEIGSLPLAFYSGFVLERRYGLSNESLGALGDATR